MKHTLTKLLALFMCLITMLSFVPAVASADEEPFQQTVTIESQTNSAFDYLEYYNGSKWKDLNTPRHWVESTGQVCYCIEHTDGNPHGATYTATAPSQVFGANTLAGLQTILMYGYPCNTPDGFTEDEARQATANAIRFWLSENGEPGSYSFTNRKAHPTYIRAKRGYEHVLEWADELLQMARDKKTLSHSIEFTPSALTLTKSGDKFTGQTTVKLTNINSGYTLDTSGLPAGVTITGYTGTKGEQLTITANSNLTGRTFNITAAGKDTRALQNVVATITTDSNGHAETPLLPFGQYTVQEVSAPAGYVIDDSVRTVKLEYKDAYTPIVYGDVEVNNERIPTSIKIKKMTDFFNTSTMKFEAKPLEGAIFGVYTAENISIIPKDTLVDLLTTGADGIAVTTSKLPFGKYYLRELKLPYDDIHLSQESFPLEVKGTNLDYFRDPIWNERFKGNIALWKEDESTIDRMLEGAQYEIRDGSGLLYDTMITDKDGYALSIDLPVGTYYVQEVVPPAGFILSDEVIEVKITTDDKNTIVFERDNTPNHVVLKKTDLTTGKPVPDAIIKITNANGDVIFEGETDLNGEIILYELPAGTYTYKETVAADGFTINDETFTFTVDYYGNVTGTTQITDEPICLQIDKVDLFTNRPFPYVEFQLVDQDDQIVRTIVAYRGAEAQIEEAPVYRSIVISNDDEYRIWARDGQDTFFVDENGHVEFRYLPKGEYRLIEVAPDGYIAEEQIVITLTDHDGVSNPKVVRVENCPTGIKILKIDASSGNPLMGAGFRIKIKGENDFETLKFRALDDGSFFVDPDGSITDLMVDGNGEITMYGIPLGDIWVEECVTPDGYFPISAQKLTVTKEMSNSNPYTMTIKNNKFVKLGMDSDWWEFPALCGGILLLIAGAAVGIVMIVRRKRRMEA